jgi:hypothetical protein
MTAPAREQLSSASYPVPRDQIKFEQGGYGLRYPGGMLPMDASVSRAQDNTYRVPDVLEVMWFGKVHLVTSAEFIENAAKYHKMLGKELACLMDAVTTHQRLYNEFLHPPDSWIQDRISASVNWFTEFKHSLKDEWGGMMPSPAKFDQLWKDLVNIGHQVDKKDLSYPLIREIGISLQHVRVNLNALNKDIAVYRGLAIDSAEQMTQGLETVESTSFQVLNLVPTIMMWDPFREAAYKLSMMLLRGSARSAGAALAESNVLRELLGVVKQDFPPIVVDMIGGCFSKVLKASNIAPLGRETLVWFVQQNVEFTSDVILLLVDKKGNMDAEDLKQIGMKRVHSSLAKIISLLFGGNPNARMSQQLAQALIESTCNTIHQDLLAAFQKAHDAKPPMDTWEVIVQELPWMMVKIIQGTIIGALNRRANTMAEVGRQTGAADSLTGEAGTREGFEYLRAQKASAIFGGKIVGTKAMAKQRVALPPMSKEVEAAWTEKFGLNNRTLENLRRWAHDEGLIIAFRLPNAAFAKLLAEAGVIPKPSFVKGKTCDVEGHDLEARVVKYRESPPSHARKDAKEAWETSLPSMKENGCMVREDGLVFHPGMLDLKGVIEDPGLRAKVKQVLQEVHAKSWDLEDRNDPKSIEARAILDKHPDVKEALNKAVIGYFPDLDFAEAVNAETGERHVMGSGASDEHPFQVNVARINQDRQDRAFNIKHDMAVSPGSLDKPAMLSMVQHGPDWEFYKGPVGGSVGVIGPNGRFHLLLKDESIADTKASNKEIKNRWEEYLKTELGEKYTPHEDRGLQLRKANWTIDTSWQEAQGKGTIRGATQKYGGVMETNRTERWTRYYERNLHDLEGKGVVADQQSVGEEPIHPNDVIGGAMHRGLHPILPGTPNTSFLPIQQEQRTFIAHDTELKNFVIMAMADQTVGEALVRLARTASDTGLLNSKAKVYYEIYTSFRPVSTAGIISRIGGANHGISEAGSDVEQALSSQAKVKGKILAAFATGGMEDTYAPSAAEHENTLLRLGFERETARNAGDYGKVQGIGLMDVWEDRAGKVEFKPTQIGRRPVVVFPSTPATIPHNVDISRIELVPTISMPPAA